MGGRRWEWAAVLVMVSVGGAARAQEAGPGPGAVVRDGFEARAGLRGSTAQGLGMLLAGEYSAGRVSFGLAPGLNFAPAGGNLVIGPGGSGTTQALQQLVVSLPLFLRVWLAPRTVGALAAFVPVSVGANLAMVYGQSTISFTVGINAGAGLGVEYSFSAPLGLYAAALAQLGYAFGSIPGPGASLSGELGVVFHL